MMTILIILLIITVFWAVFEAIQKKAIIYFITKENILLSEEQMAECLKEVIMNYLHLK